MPNSHKLSRQACLVTIIQAKFHQLFQGRANKHNFGQALKLQSAVVTLNIRPRS